VQLPLIGFTGLLNGTVNKQILADRKDLNDKTLKYIKEDLDLKIQILNELKNNRATEQLSLKAKIPVH